MCGIVGYIPSTKSYITKDIINSLKQLEYRGYDSAGLTLNLGNNFYTLKSLGHIQNLQKKITKKTPAYSGIAHTRWATHGKVNLENTHPHFSHCKSWCVVHNGIIENHLKLKTKLSKSGTVFYGETDTEVVPNLIAKSKGKTTLQKFANAIKKLDGSYAICAMNKDEKQTLYLAKNNSPLYVAKSSSLTMCSSDPICFDDRFDFYYSLPDFCVAKLCEKSVEFFDLNLNKIKLKKIKTNKLNKNVKLNKFKYFAEKEIKEIPFVIRNIINLYKNNNYLNKIKKSYLNKIKHIYFIGCGTALNACQIGAQFLSQKTGIISSCHIASEFRYLSPRLDKSTLCIFASQSGETADTLLCLKMAKSCGAKTISLVNVLHSSIATISDIVLPLCAGPEIAVISTKAYVAMLLVFYILAQHFYSLKTGTQLDYSMFEDLEKVSYFKNTKNLNIFTDQILKSNKVFFVGKCQDYATSTEASLKLKEITYINCVSLPLGELKHGTLSLVDEHSLVFVVATKKDLLEKTLTGASEIKSRGGKVVLFTNLNLSNRQTKSVDMVHKFAKSSEDFANILCIIPFQMLALKTCLALNLNPDKPRNLAKSVTVE